MRESDWDGVCGVPGIGNAVITDGSAHKHWDEENIGNLGKTNLKERLFKMFQYTRGNMKLKNKEFESNSSYTFSKSKMMDDALTCHKTEIQPERVSAFCTQEPRKLEIKQIKSLPFQRTTLKTEHPAMASLSTYLHLKLYLHNFRFHQNC